MSRPLPTREGRFGVRQFDALTGEMAGGTIGMGWSTRVEAEAANTDSGSWCYEVFDRWPYLPEGETLPVGIGRKPVETVQTTMFDAA